jgi:hypothetical protein
MMKTIFSMVLVLSSLILIQGCSSGSGSDNDDTTTTAPDALTGTAATGAPIAGDVTVKDANGIELTIATSSDGSFTLDVASLTPPYLLKVMPADGTDTLYSFASENGQTVNLTPATNLVMFLANGKADLDTLYGSWDGTGVSETEVQAAEETVRANLFDQMQGDGVGAASFDLLTSPFTADGTGFDKVLDDITIAVDASAGTFTFLADIAFDENATLPATGGSISITTVTGAKHVLNGTYTTGCHDDGGDFVDEVVVFSGTTWSYTQTQYTDAACTTGGTPGSATATVSASADSAITGWRDGSGPATAPTAADNVTVITDTEAFTQLRLTITDVGGFFVGAITVGEAENFFYIVDDTGAKPILYRDDSNDTGGLDGGTADPYTQQ